MYTVEQWHELANELAKYRQCGYYGAKADIATARGLYGEVKAYTGIKQLATEPISWCTAFSTTANEFYAQVA